MTPCGVTWCRLPNSCRPARVKAPRLPKIPKFGSLTTATTCTSPFMRITLTRALCARTEPNVTRPAAMTRCRSCSTRFLTNSEPTCSRSTPLGYLEIPSLTPVAGADGAGAASGGRAEGRPRDRAPAVEVASVRVLAALGSEEIDRGTHCLRLVADSSRTDGWPRWQFRSRASGIRHDLMGSLTSGDSRLAGTFATNLNRSFGHLSPGTLPAS